MMRTLKAAIKCGMDFSTGIFAGIKNFMFLDGMVTACNPRAGILEDMRVCMLRLRELIKGVE